MPTTDERFADLADRHDPDLMRVISDIDEACSSLTLPPQRDAAIAHSLTRQAAETQTTLARHRIPRLRLGVPKRLASAGIAAGLLLAGAGAYLHEQGAATASAQTILRHATTAGISPTRAAHSVYRLTTSRGDRGTADVWIEADTSGSPVGFSLTQRMARGGSTEPQLSTRRLQIGETVQTYNSATNTVQMTPVDGSSRQLATMFAGPLIAFHLSSLASQHGVRVLPQTTLNGARADVLQVGNGRDANTFYFDARSYVLRGVDWASNGASWHARLRSYATVRLSAVPANAFSLNAPQNAHIDKPATGAGDDFLGLMAGACHSSPQAVLDDMRAHLDSTGLEICRDTNPSITSDQLVAALSPFPGAATKISYFVSHPVRYLSILAQ